MRMRSVAVLMQVATSIDVNHIAGNEITLDRESYGVCDVLWPAMPLKRHGRDLR